MAKETRRVDQLSVLILSNGNEPGFLKGFRELARREEVKSQSVVPCDIVCLCDLQSIHPYEKSRKGGFNVIITSRIDDETIEFLKGLPEEKKVFLRSPQEKPKMKMPKNFTWVFTDPEHDLASHIHEAYDLITFGWKKKA